MLNFLLGMIFMFVILLIFSVLSINPRDDDYRTRKGKGTHNNEVWKGDGDDRKGA